jgi:hypothetical protein
LFHHWRADEEVGMRSFSCDLAVGLGKSLNFVDWHDDETSSRTPDNNSKLVRARFAP